MTKKIQFPQLGGTVYFFLLKLLSLCSHWASEAPKKVKPFPIKASLWKGTGQTSVCLMGL